MNRLDAGDNTGPLAGLGGFLPTMQVPWRRGITMSYRRYSQRPGRTLLGSYFQGFDLLGTTARRDLARYRRRDGLAIQDAWRRTGEALGRAMENCAREDAARARTRSSTPTAV